MQIQVWFSNDKYIDIGLFNNDTIIKWFDYYSQYESLDYYGANIISLIGHSTPPTSTVEKQWNSILNTIDKLVGMGYNIPFQVSPIFDYSQTTLNLLHRFFTYNAAWYWDNKDSVVLNPFDNNFRLPSDINYTDWLGIIDPINAAVHQLEHYTELNNNKKFVIENFPIQTVNVWPKNRAPTNLDSWLPFTDEDQRLNYTYFDSELPLVILSNTILGKSIMQSFYEDDNLNAKDCTGRLGSYGGFFIDLDSNRKKIYQSSQFKNWALKHNRNVDSLPLEFSIGYVKNYQEVLQWIDNTLQFKKIVFNKQDK